METPFSPAPLRLGRKAQALLSYLGLQGSAGASRSRLIDLLWTEHSEEEARGAFRQCLHLLRRTLGEAGDLLETDGERLVLRDAACDVDVRRFEALAASADLSARLAALQLYRGDFVESLDTGPEFSRWALGERERLRDLAHGVLTHVAEQPLDAASRAQAVQCAHLLLASDPLHEGCWRALMSLHASAGLRAKALQAWNECRETLRRELDIEPSVSTAALADELFGDSSPQGAARGGADQPVVPVVSPARDGDDPRVVDLNLRGWESYTTYTVEGNRLARAAFEQAASLAGDHAQVIARAGWTHWTDAISGWTPDPEAAMERAWQWASRALACNRGRFSTPHSLMGKILLWRGRHDEALEQFRVGVALEPTYAWPHFHLADGLMWSAQCEEALAEVGRALELDQNDHGMFLTVRGLALWILGELQAAQVALDSAITRNPTYAWAYMAMAIVHVERGNLARAREVADIASRLHPSFSLAHATRVFPFKLAEHRKRQLDALRACGVPREEAPPRGAATASGAAIQGRAPRLGAA